MKETRRIEIVIDRRQAPSVVKVFEAHSLSGWTRLRVEAGAGERGVRRDDEISGASSTSLLLTTCRPEKLDALLDDLRPILKRFGGFCLVSEASWLKL